MSFGKRPKADYLLLKLDQINNSFKVRGGVSMLDVAFTYSYEESKWIKCTDTELDKKEIEDIPCVTLINYIGNLRRLLAAGAY